MNANMFAPRPADPQSQLVVEPTALLRLLPAPEHAQTGGRGSSPRATTTPPFWTWFIANPRCPRGV